MEYKEQINDLYYQLVEQKYNSNCQYIHDFHKHINIIYRMLLNNELDHLNDYIHNMFQVSLSLSNNICSGNKYLEMIIDSLSEQINRKSIKIKYKDIEEIEFDSNKMFNLTSIFYNIMDNAINNCSSNNIPYIAVSLYSKNTNFITFKVVNTCTINDYNEESKNNHGIGMINIKENVENLNGKYIYNYDSNNELYKTTIIIPIDCL
ncbi:MAG: GHKL domain-containing protein [Erysipelotrichaceae bacterium]|nr:GHKL domain-containing protein [Erysipelotrichaceae bacterium]